ncbi:hypothetical protein H2201_003292 [Coniosporium apollinis]|uniref:Uncharacterized protein n=2 Tax=Coniosporium TaxID=2810619 RepID=A0ABQ9NY22_9PEZI|nr:hypothetical protein H2199_008659 [Cladosporium sp. JES 115]KAJ9666633.1 hypothetical protein H2201_003292 [Coniosporium apollinis]
MSGYVIITGRTGHNTPAAFAQLLLSERFRDSSNYFVWKDMSAQDHNSARTRGPYTPPTDIATPPGSDIYEISPPLIAYHQPPPSPRLTLHGPIIINGNLVMVVSTVTILTTVTVMDESWFPLPSTATVTAISEPIPEYHTTIVTATEHLTATKLVTVTAIVATAP